MFIFAEVGQENLIVSLLDFRSNIINWILLVVVLVWLVKKYVPSLLLQRQQAINNELELAKKARQDAEEALAEQKRLVGQAAQEAEKIISEAKKAAKRMSEDLKQQTEAEVSDLYKKFEMAASNERQAAILEMRNIVAKAAIKLTEENLKSALTADNKTKIAHDFMGELSKIGSSNMSGERVGNGSQPNAQKVGQTN